MSTKPIKTVLLVEDNAGDARLLREMLGDYGANSASLKHAESMVEAEAQLTATAVDVILLDLGLPDVSGLEAVRRARNAAPRTPLVVLTGLDDETLAARALQEGAQDYLIKGQITSDAKTETRGLMRALRYAVERQAMEDALFAEKERAQVTLDSIADAVICTDISSRVTFLNTAAETLTGWRLQDATSEKLEAVFTVLNAKSRARIQHPTEKQIEDRQFAKLPSNCILVRRDGSECPIEDSVAPIRDREGRPAGAVIVFRDVTLAQAMSRKMAYTAEHDFLTGLPNRMLFNDRVKQAIALASRHHKHVAVLFLDLDGFKNINDSFGHACGDKVLQSVASRLVDCVRRSDTVSRQGGDEFVVLLSEIEHAEDAAITARRMLDAVSKVHSIDGRELHITTSIGVSVFPDDGLDAEALVKNADTAMYQAKEQGRRGFRFFKPAMNVRAVERQFMEEALRRALKREEFELHYQPRIDLRTGAIVGAEALLQWIHPTRGAIASDQFVPIAEDCGLIVAIGRWVLRESCRQARAWHEAGLTLASISVNISAMEFQHENFIEGIFETLAESGLDPNLLELELTESVLMKRAEFTSSILTVLRSRGVQVVIDDFGTGYSSLRYLRRFPVEALKIDRSFVRQISAAGDDPTIVTAVINMARSLNLRVVAEGVESAEELAFLQDNHCDEGQGQHFSPPVPREQFAGLLKAGFLPIGAGRATDSLTTAGAKLMKPFGATETVRSSSAR